MGRTFLVAAAIIGSIGAGVQKPAEMVFLTRDGCVQTDQMRANLDAALKGLKRSTDYAVMDADALGEKDVRRGYGTPTVLVAGHDLFGMPTPEPGTYTPT